MKSEFLLGMVESIVDPSHTFKLYVKLLEDGRKVNVTYTSPFFHKTSGGAIAVPNVGSKILILKNIDYNKYYYISTIVEGEPDPYDPDVIDPTHFLYGITRESYYTDKDIPQRITFTNEQNAGLVIRDERLSGYIASEVKLQSDKGKIVSLQDSPLDNKINIRNEHGDGIRVTSDSIGSVFYNDEHHGLLASRSIYLMCAGDQNMVSYTGGIKLMISEGREIDIKNCSTGAGGDNASAGIIAGSNERCGNVNITSEDSDVNIRAGTDSNSRSAVFISTPKGRIQINYDGSIDISCKEDINIRSLSGNITLQANKDIKMKCSNFVVNTTGNFGVNAAGTFHGMATGNAGLTGTQVHLNSPGIPPEPPTIGDISTPATNAYEE